MKRLVQGINLLHNLSPARFVALASKADFKYSRLTEFFWIAGGVEMAALRWTGTNQQKQS